MGLARRPPPSGCAEDHQGCRPIAPNRVPRRPACIAAGTFGSPCGHRRHPGGRRAGSGRHPRQPPRNTGAVSHAMVYPISCSLSRKKGANTQSAPTTGLNRHGRIVGAWPDRAGKDLSQPQAQAQQRSQAIHGLHDGPPGQRKCQSGSNSEVWPKSFQFTGVVGDRHRTAHSGRAEAHRGSLPESFSPRGVHPLGG